MKNDIIFLKKLYEITTEEEIQRLIKLNDKLDLSPQDSEEIELFFIHAGKLVNSLYEAVVNLCETFDFDLDNLIKNTHLLEKLSAEKKKPPLMEEFFV